MHAHGPIILSILANMMGLDLSLLGYLDLTGEDESRRAKLSAVAHSGGEDQN